MTRYDYITQLKDDITTYLIDNDIILEDLNDRELEKLGDDLWAEDSVTGNASGSYTMNTYQAEENIAHSWDLIEEVAEVYGIDPIISSDYSHGAEWWDVNIRCYLLNEALYELVKQ